MYERVGGDLMNRSDALELIRNHVKNDKLIKHMIAVEAIMRKLASKFNEDQDLWGLVGLLHDLDYEETKKDFKRHGIMSAEMLEGKLPEEALEAIRSHNELTGHIPKTRLAKALIAADQVSGLIVATALVMPNKKLAEVKLKSLKRKFKQKDFARSVDRNKILKYCQEIGLTLEEFLQLSLEALQSISNELGL